VCVWEGLGREEGRRSGGGEIVIICLERASQERVERTFLTPFSHNTRKCIMHPTDISFSVDFSGGRFGSEEADYFYSTWLRRPYPAYPGPVSAVGWAAASAMIAILLRLVGEGKFLAAARRASTQVQFG